MAQKLQIGEKLRLLRRKNDVTQDRLAEYLGVTPQAVSRWESGVCYPDMETLPRIADFFSISMDELFSYDGHTQKTAKEYLDRVDYLTDREQYEEALTLLREAVAAVPSHFGLQLALASVLSALADEEEATTEQTDAYLKEAVSLCEHILSDCTDDGLRDEAKKALCGIYSHQIGNDSKAQDIADQLHSLSFSREIIRATVLTGDVAFQQAQANLILFADNIWWHLYNLACVPAISGNRYTMAEKIAILKKGIDLFEVIFDGGYLFYADRLTNSYRQLCMFYIADGKIEDALACFEKMADYAIAFDTRPDRAAYPSVLLRSVVYDKTNDTEARGMSKCARLLESRFAARIWTPIRSHARFRDAVKRMADCAAALESN